jgi:hypothetical protein
MPEPLQTVQQAIDRTFGDGYAREQPELVAGVLIAAGLRDIATALLVEEAEPSHIVPAREWRPRP